MSLVYLLTEDQTVTEDRGWSSVIPRRRILSRSSSALFDPLSLRSWILHLPQPVPWPFLQRTRVRQLNVAFFCSNSLFIEMQFVSERSKVAFLISLRAGRALLWARAIWNSQSSLINSFDSFSAHFREVFGLSTGSLSIADQHIRLWQGTSSVSMYTLQFRTLAASCGWNETALLTAYRQGLDPQIRTQMAIYDDHVGLENFMQKAVKISQRLTASLPDETAHSQASPAACPPVPEPMQLDSNRLTRTERARRLATGLCLYCGALSKSVPLVPHTQRWVHSRLNLISPSFRC